MKQTKHFLTEEELGIAPLLVVDGVVVAATGAFAVVVAIVCFVVVDAGAGVATAAGGGVAVAVAVGVAVVVTSLALTGASLVFDAKKPHLPQRPATNHLAHVGHFAVIYRHELLRHVGT